MILLGSDVKALFPSLSEEMTGEQFMKSPLQWQKVDWKLVALYVKMQENFCCKSEVSEIKKYLPEMIKTNGRPSSIGTIGLESRYKWPGPM